MILTSCHMEPDRLIWQARLISIATQGDAAIHGTPSTPFTEWKSFDPESDLLFYEGLHRALVTDAADPGNHVRLLTYDSRLQSLDNSIEVSHGKA